MVLTRQVVAVRVHYKVMSLYIFWLGNFGRHARKTVYDVLETGSLYFAGTKEAGDR